MILKFFFHILEILYKSIIIAFEASNRELLSAVDPCDDGTRCVTDQICKQSKFTQMFFCPVCLLMVSPIPNTEYWISISISLLLLQNPFYNEMRVEIKSGYELFLKTFTFIFCDSASISTFLQHRNSIVDSVIDPMTTIRME